MPTVTVETVRVDGVTFVEAILELERPSRVRLQACFDDAIWPPRTNGSVVDGWDSTGVTIEADARSTAIGFATPAITHGKPIEIVRSEPYETGRTKTQAWIDQIEARVESAEPLASAATVPEAADAVAAVGGLVGVETLASAIDRDRRVAMQVSVIPEELSQRLERVEIPTGTLTTLAEGKRQ